MATGADGLAGGPPPRSGAADGGRRLLAVAFAAAMLASPALADDDADLHDLAARGDEARLARAIATGSPVDERDSQGRTPLHVAAREGRLFVAMVLVGHHADVNARDDQRRTPLHMAAQGTEREGERFQVLKLLLAKGADPKLRDAAEKRPVDYAHTPEFKEALAP